MNTTYRLKLVSAARECERKQEQPKPSSLAEHTRAAEARIRAVFEAKQEQTR